MPKFTGGTGEIDNGIGAVSSNVGVSTAALYEPTTYTLAVTNPAGTKVTAPLTVNVQTVAMSDITPANPKVAAGGQIKLNATVSGAFDTRITWYVSEGSIDSTGLWTAPPAPVTPVTITATAMADGTTQKTTTGTVNWGAPPTVVSIDPSSGLNDSSLRVTNLAGTGFRNGAVVKLVKSGQSDVVAANVMVESAIKISCDLDLNGRMNGAWDIVVTNDDAQSGTLAGGFYVTDLWKYAGNTGFSGGTADYVSLSVSNGVPYVAYKDSINGDMATVMKFDGSAWVGVGVAGFSAGTAEYVSLDIYNGVPYVAYRDWANGYRATVMKFNGSAWETVGSAGFSAGQATYTSLTIYNGVPYVAYQDEANGYRATVMKFNGSSWINIGNAGFSAGQANYTSLRVYSDVPYVAYQDVANGNKISVMKYSSSTWANVGASGFSSGSISYPSLGLSGSVPYVAFQDAVNGYKATVMKLNGTAWENVGGAGFSAAQAFGTSLNIYGGVPYVAYYESNGGSGTTVMKFNGSTWETVGKRGFSGGTPYSPSLYVFNGVPYVAFVDLSNGQKLSVMQYTRTYDAPSVSSITPASGLNNASINITDLSGNYFRAGASVRLVRAGYTDIPATAVTVTSATKITCSIDITKKEEGPWDVVVTNSDALSGILYQGFSISYPEGAHWVKTAENQFDPRRYGHSSVVFNDKIWVIGGYDGKYYLNDVWSSSDGINWSSAPTPQFSGRAGHTSVVYNGKLWVIGGEDATGGKLNEVWSTSTGSTWVKSTAEVPFTARSYHSSEVFNGYMWVIGGDNGSTTLNDLWYSSNGYTWTHIVPTGPFTVRKGHSTVVFNSKLWVIGGDNGSITYEDVWSSPTGAGWTRVTPSAEFYVKTGHTSVVFNGKMRLIGGEYLEKSESYNEVWSSTNGINWVLATDSAAFPKRNNHSSVVFNAGAGMMMWVIGGIDSNTSEVMTDVWDGH